MMVPSTSDERVANNVMRHEYRVLTDAEKAGMLRLKDLGLAFIQAVKECVPEGREASIAKTKIEEAVMWSVKGLTS